MSSLEKLRKLASYERRILLGSAWRLSWARLQTKVIPFRRIVKSLETSDNGRSSQPSRPSVDHAAAVKWATSVLSAKLPWCRNCLAQAIAAKRYLNRQGIASTLYLGVTTEPGANELDAHAWLECGNQILTGESATDYKIIYSQS